VEPVLASVHDGQRRIVLFGEVVDCLRWNQTVIAAIKYVRRNIPFDGVVSDITEIFIRQDHTIQLLQVDDGGDEKGNIHQMIQMCRHSVVGTDAVGYQNNVLIVRLQIRNGIM